MTDGQGKRRTRKTADKENAGQEKRRTRKTADKENGGQGKRRIEGSG
ncbi:hypothetical protein [Proteiniphilum sp. X52]|nr:hypothetical protein [Proteiniphilum sp. X52]